MKDYGDNVALSLGSDLAHFIAKYSNIVEEPYEELTKSYKMKTAILMLHIP